MEQPHISNNKLNTNDIGNTTYISNTEDTNIDTDKKKA